MVRGSIHVLAGPIVEGRTGLVALFLSRGWVETERGGTVLSCCEIECGLKLENC